MSNILITGGTGFLGSRICRLLAREHEVWVITRAIPENFDANVRWIKHDLSLGTPIFGLPRGIDTVIHFAQSERYREFPKSGDDIYQISVGATGRLLNWAYRTGVEQFFLGSTGGVYGTSRQPAKESDGIPEPSGELQYYFRTKIAAEQLLQGFQSQFNTTAFRFFFLYGDGQSENMLLPRLIRQIQSGVEIALNGEDGLIFNPLHVDDAAELVVAALDREVSGVFNLAGPETVSLKEVCMKIADASCVSLKVGSHDGKTGYLVGDTSKAEVSIGKPTTKIMDYLSELLAS